MNAMKRSVYDLAIAGSLAAGTACGQYTNNAIKLGVLTDVSNLHTDLASGPGGSDLTGRACSLKDGGCCLAK